MLDADDLRFACDDARQRGAAVVELIHSGDRQALTLLQVYAVTTIAGVSAAAAIYFSGTSIPKHLAWIALGMSLALFAGAILCVCAMWTARIVLPGRDPDFWIWAMHPGVKAEGAYRAYLEQLSKLQDQNRAVNETMASRLDWAKRLGVLSPFLGFVGLFLAVGFRV